MKAFQLTYSFEGNHPDVFYDMYYIISYQNELNLDRLTGKLPVLISNFRFFF